MTGACHNWRKNAISLIDLRDRVLSVIAWLRQSSDYDNHPSADLRRIKDAAVLWAARRLADGALLCLLVVAVAVLHSWRSLPQEVGEWLP